jgi:hypothetical protein
MEFFIYLSKTLALSVVGAEFPHTFGEATLLVS